MSKRGDMCQGEPDPLALREPHGGPCGWVGRMADLRAALLPKFIREQCEEMEAAEAAALIRGWRRRIAEEGTCTQ